MTTASTNTSTITNSSSGNNIMLGLNNHGNLEWSKRQSLNSSRHVTDFEYLHHSNSTSNPASAAAAASATPIGSGAFGQVYKVRNKIDGKVYALKRVSDDYSYHSTTVLREVQLLSSLHHDHVVRYYGAWMEQGVALVDDDRAEDHCGESLWNDDKEQWTTSEKSLVARNETADPVCHLCLSSYRDWEVSFEHWGLLDSVLQPLNLCTECYVKSIPKDMNASDIHIREKQVLKDYLFILMEYCDGTLQEVSEHCTDQEKWSYFQQCLDGLTYLHSSGIIHRDIKPSNILIRNGVVKIGDLGLATASAPQSTSSRSSSHTSGTSSRKSSHVGTYLYTAPELETGKYDEKCDVFSLGVVLVELFSKFETGMERVETLGEKRLRKGILPTNWEAQFPMQAAMALQMVAADPSMRPSCRKVLDDYFGRPQPPSSTANNGVAELEKQVHDKDDTIRKLRQLLDRHQISHEHI